MPEREIAQDKDQRQAPGELEEDLVHQARHPNRCQSEVAQDFVQQHMWVVEPGAFENLGETGRKI